MTNDIKIRGDLFVISAPSGAGKSTVCHRVLKEMNGIAFSISHTTRTPRHGEINGRDYHFVSRKRFKEMINSNAFIEWAEVHGNLYGTSYTAIETLLDQGMDVLLDVDVQGKRNISRIFSKAVSIFILPPSMAELKKRLESRGTDDETTIGLRLRNAVLEMRQIDNYDFLIINDELNTAVEDMKAIIRSRRCATSRVLAGDLRILHDLETATGD